MAAFDVLGELGSGGETAIPSSNNGLGFVLPALGGDSTYLDIDRDFAVSGSRRPCAPTSLHITTYLRVRLLDSSEE